MKMLLRAALVLSGLQLAAGPTAAQPVDPLADNAAALAAAGDTASQVAFAYADRNADLLVSWEEYRNRALRLFTHVDTNEDGVMQIAELAALAGPSAPAAPFDVSAGTFNAAARKAFDDADKDKNGALTPAEWAKVLRPSKLF